MGCGCSAKRSARIGADLEAALRSGSAEAISRLLDAGLDPNDSSSGPAPLLLAAQARATPEIFAALLDAGADPKLAVLDGAPLPFHTIGWEDGQRALAVLALFTERGEDLTARTSGGDEDTLLLRALKARDVVVARDLITRGLRVDDPDAAGNTPLHVAGALADEDIVAALMARGGVSELKNVDGHSPIMSARLGEIARERRRSPAGHWCFKEVLKAHTKDHVTNIMLPKGDEVWRCETTGWCCSTLTGFHPAFPRNHHIAARMAVSQGGVYGLTDAVEGAWLSGQAPPQMPLEEVHPEVMAAIKALVTALQNELRKGLETKDHARLQAGVEMLRYAKVAKLPEEEQATRMLVRMDLEAALVPPQGELRLKQALMSATQYGHSDIPLFESAEVALKKIIRERKLRDLLEDLGGAMERKDHATVYRLLRAGKAGDDGSFASHPEVVRGGAFLEQLVKQELQRAVSTCNKKAARAACALAEGYDLTSLSGYQRLLALRTQICIQALQDMAASAAEEPLRLALKDALEDPDLRACNLKEHEDFKAVLRQYREILGLPPYFDEEQLLSKVTDRHSSVVQKQLESDTLQTAFQQLLDSTYKMVRTKDRRGAVPLRLTVKAVSIVRNADNFIGYSRRRREIEKQLAGPPPVELSDLRSKAVCKTFAAMADGRFFHSFVREHHGLAADPINPSINEFYLLHGTSPSAVVAITEGDFRLDLAGSNAGTLYGRGIYFGECSSKSDEYSHEDSRQWTPMLVCRVTLGNILYVDQEYPVTSNLVKSCTEGQYHSVLGDREKIRNTFREFIIYDSDQAYPEFVVWYARG